MLFATTCTAATIIVNWDGSGDYITIQEGIDAAGPNDTVVVAQGIYTGNNNRDLDFGGKAITVRSTDPNDPDIVDDTVIDCEDAGRGFIFYSGEGPNSVVAGFTIVRGHAENGGAIYCHSSSPKINNCTIKYNSVETYSGGGIYCSDDSNPTVSNCIIHNNWCKGEHGPSLSSPYNGGGGICCASSDMQIINCTIVDNETGMGRGGGVLCRYDGEIKIDNCIIWDNNAPEGTEIGVAHSFIASPSNPTLTVSYSDVKGGQAGAFNFIGTINWNLGNIDTDPCFADPCNGDYHLQSEAGRWDPNQSDWVYDANTSLCIDAGNPGCPPGDEPLPNGNRINMGVYGGTAEASKSPVNWRSIADLTNDWAVDFNDLAGFVDYWLDSGQCLPGDLNRNQSVDFYDFAEFAACWLTSVE